MEARYLPRLDSQTDDEYATYKARASFFNATARTADGSPPSAAHFKLIFPPKLKPTKLTPS